MPVNARSVTLPEAEQARERLQALLLPVGDCLIFQGQMRGGPYGRIKIGGSHGRALLTHRVAYALAHGEAPEGVLVLHRCDTPLCRNPQHLFLGTNRDNAQDRKRKGRGGYLKGEANGRATISESMAREILRATGPNKAVAANLGVPYGVVWGIRSRRRWKHLEIT